MHDSLDQAASLLHTTVYGGGNWFLDNGAQSATSNATESKTSEADEGTNRPPGVKASMARGKKTVEGKGLSEFQTMWSIKQQDLAMKEKLSKMSLLDGLIGKKNHYLSVRKL
ncbi:hypothetical protein Bca101_050439 [Brassica carinata]